MTASVRQRPRAAARRGLVLGLVGLFGLVAGCGGDDDESIELLGVTREPVLDVASTELPAAKDGTAVTMKAAEDGLMVVYFGYTSCPDICPTTMSDLARAVNDLPADEAERVAVAFATVDPERDTAEVLEGYLGSFFDDGVALRTDDADALAEAAGAFGVEYDVADHDAGDRDYDVAHTAVTYVVDDTGRVVVEWPFGFAAQDMTTDLNTLLQEDT
ncbi:MAG: SCO family protein [Desertimonas sp.]